MGIADHDVFVGMNGEICTNVLAQGQGYCFRGAGFGFLWDVRFGDGIKNRKK